jgi:hypothetical protein
MVNNGIQSPEVDDISILAYLNHVHYGKYLNGE